MLKVALTTLLVGLFSLYFFAETKIIDETAIARIDGIDKGAMVKIMGRVTESSIHDNVQFLAITQPESVKVFVYDPRQPIPEGSMVEVIGHVEEYKKKKEIIADRIRIVG